jgi:hypothetical protein
VVAALAAILLQGALACGEDEVGATSTTVAAPVTSVSTTVPTIDFTPQTSAEADYLRRFSAVWLLVDDTTGRIGQSSAAISARDATGLVGLFQASEALANVSTTGLQLQSPPRFAQFQSTCAEAFDLYLQGAAIIRGAWKSADTIVLRQGIDLIVEGNDRFATGLTMIPLTITGPNDLMMIAVRWAS